MFAETGVTDAPPVGTLRSAEEEPPARPVEVGSAVETLDGARMGSRAVRGLIGCGIATGVGRRAGVVAVVGVLVILVVVVLVVPVVFQTESDLHPVPQTHSHLLWSKGTLLSEDGATDPHDGRALLDGHSEVVAHAHRELG